MTDEFHTMDELYDYRMLYNALAFNSLPESYTPVKSLRHADGEFCFGGGWFIVMAELPTGQISNHYPIKDWELFAIDDVERAPEWDGHSPTEAAERMREYLITYAKIFDKESRALIKYRQESPNREVVRGARKRRDIDYSGNFEGYVEIANEH